MLTARALIADAAARFDRAGLHFGHGTEDALDEAAFLVLHALGLPPDTDGAALDRPLEPAAADAAEALVARRLDTRSPAAYLTGRTWFAGLEFVVDERVLVPRSPLAELVLDAFQPWLGTTRVRRALDVGTGSGCIAIALALAFPDAEVHATDVSADALEVARENRARHRLERRLVLHEADLFPPAGGRFELVVSNPPYVPDAALATLPPEFGHEPAGGLAAGRDGTDVAARLLAGAREALTPDGLLVVEVGESREALERRFPRVPFTWVDLERGGEGVFVLRADELGAL